MFWKLFFSAVSKFFFGVALVAVLVFLPAGTWAYWQGWLFMGVLFFPMAVFGIVLLFTNPKLLEKRLDAKEKQKDQEIVVKLSGLMFLSGFIVAGLGYRFGWYVLPVGVTIGAAALFMVAYVLYAELLRENAYLSRTIEVQQGQYVVDIGLYGVVRHPMYAVTLLLFSTIPLILGSLYSFLIFLVYPLIIAKRIQGEEALLMAELPGYADYTKKVKYRLIPLVW